MKRKLQLLALLILLFIGSAKAQWTPFDTTQLKIGGIECIGSAKGSDTLYVFNSKNTMYVYKYSTKLFIDSIFNAGPAYPSQQIEVNRHNGNIIYRHYSGFGAPSWKRKTKTGTVTTIVNSANLSDKMEMSPSGVLYYRKKAANAIQKSTDDGTTFNTVFSHSKGCNLSGISEDNGVFVSVSAIENGGIVTFDSAGIYKSLNNGANWSMVYGFNQVDTIEKVEAIKCIGNECFAVVRILKNKAANEYDGFLYSSDNGDSWTMKSITNFKGLSVHSWGIDNSGNVYYVNNNDIFRSTDKGSTFVSGYRNGIPSNSFIYNLFSSQGKVFTEVYGDLYTLGGVSNVLNTISKKNYFNVYPNPVSSELNILFNKDFVNTKVIIYNSMGQIIISEVPRQEQLSILFDKHPAGLYFINVYQNGILQSMKFVKH